MENSSPSEALNPSAEEAENRRFIYSVFWIVLLIAIVWPLGWFIAPIWVTLLAGEAFFPPIRDVTAFLEKLVLWPRALGYAIKEGQETFPTPGTYSEPDALNRWSLS